MIPELNELVREKNKFKEFEAKIIDILENIDSRLEKYEDGYDQLNDRVSGLERREE